MSEIVPSTGVVIIKNNKVLLVRHGEEAGHLTGTYGLPAGRIEKGETALETAKRELQEETGLISKKEDLIEYPSNDYVGKIRRKDGTEKIFSYKIFICRSFSGNLKASGESMPEWVDLSALDEKNLLVNVYKIIQDAKQFLDGKQI